jgi:hypothetical protein
MLGHWSFNDAWVFGAILHAAREDSITLPRCGAKTSTKRDAISREMGMGPLMERVRLHARIAETLEELYGRAAEAHAIGLAHHFVQAETLLGNEKLVGYRS